MQVQWLRTHLTMQRMWVRFLVGELRSHIPQGHRTVGPAAQAPHLEGASELQLLSQHKQKKRKKEQNFPFQQYDELMNLEGIMLIRQRKANSV